MWSGQGSALFPFIGSVGVSFSASGPNRTITVYPTNNLGEETGNRNYGEKEIKMDEM